MKVALASYFVGLGFLSGFLFGYLFKAENKDDVYENTIGSEAETVKSVSDQSAEAQSDELKSSENTLLVKQLKKRVAELERKLMMAELPLDKEKDGDAVGVANSSVLQYEYADDIVSRFQTEPFENILSDISSGFAEQELDPVWSEDQENNLYEVFEGSAELSDFAVDRIECKSTLCKVSLYLSEDQTTNAVKYVSGALSNTYSPDAKNPVTPGVFLNGATVNGLTEMYISRQGHNIFALNEE